MSLESDHDLAALLARIDELETERDRMLPIYTAHLVAEQQAAEWRESERLRIAVLTEHELHREQRHPDYEYETTENARKSSDSPMPHGDGWEANDIMEAHIYKDGIVLEERWCNWTRGDLIETNYWRRRKA